MQAGMSRASYTTDLIQLRTSQSPQLLLPNFPNDPPHLAVNGRQELRGKPVLPTTTGRIGNHVTSSYQFRDVSANCEFRHLQFFLKTLDSAFFVTGKPSQYLQTTKVTEGRGSLKNDIEQPAVNLARRQLADFANSAIIEDVDRFPHGPPNPCGHSAAERLIAIRRLGRAVAERARPTPLDQPGRRKFAQVAGKDADRHIQFLCQVGGGLFAFAGKVGQDLQPAAVGQGTSDSNDDFVHQTYQITRVDAVDIADFSKSAMLSVDHRRVNQRTG